MALFKKVWATFPGQRAELMSNFYDEADWKLPEILDYARRSLLPSSEALRFDRWYGISSTLGSDEEGRIDGVLQRVLANTTGAQLNKLRADVAAGLAEHPQWLPGPIILTIIDLRQGKTPDVAAAVLTAIGHTRK